MSERPPTPTGWSDTDWIKKLQDDEENPLACLHINQGSFDAAADAYEEEYKMSKRTALEIADQVDAYVIRTSIGAEAAAMLRQQHAEIERLKADAELVNSCAKNLAIAMHRKNFSHITQWEPLPDTRGLISQIDNMSYWTRDDVARLTASREAAIAAAVAAEREECANACRKRAESAGLYGSASAGARQCEIDIRARTAT